MPRAHTRLGQVRAENGWLECHVLTTGHLAEARAFHAHAQLVVITRVVTHGAAQCTRELLCPRYELRIAVPLDDDAFG